MALLTLYWRGAPPPEREAQCVLSLPTFPLIDSKGVVGFRCRMKPLNRHRIDVVYRDRSWYR